MRIDKDKLKNSLSKKDIENIVVGLGSNLPRVDGRGDLIFETVCHHLPDEQKQYKLYYYDNTKLFNCYTDCTGSFDIFGLVEKAMILRKQEWTLGDCIRYVADKVEYNYDFFVDDINKIDDWKFINKYRSSIKQREKRQLPEFDSKIMDVFQRFYYEGWINEGICIDTMKKFGIMYYVNGSRIVIPHRDIDGRLVGVRGRTLLEEEIIAKRKYMPLLVEKQSYAHPLSFNLYGLYENMEGIKKHKKVIIFESEKSVMQCNGMYGEDNFAVACCGSAISKYQRDMILDTGAEEVFIAFDRQYVDYNSQECNNYIQKLLALAYKFAPYMRTYIILDKQNLLGHKDSPSDHGKQTLEYLMSKKIEVKTK